MSAPVQGCVHPRKGTSRPPLISQSTVSLAKSQPQSTNPLNQSTVNFIIDQGLLDALLVELRTHLCSLKVQISGLFLQVTTLPSDVRCDPSECSELSGLLQFPVRDRPLPWQGSFSLSRTTVHFQVLWKIESERELLRAHSNIFPAWPVELCPAFVTLSSSERSPVEGEQLSHSLVVDLLVRSEDRPSSVLMLATVRPTADTT